MHKAEPLRERVGKTISRYNMLDPGARVGVAVSGGADSICLLHVLNELAADLDLRLHVLHLNHGLRGAESDGDMDFVAGVAKRLNLAARIESCDVRLSGGNLEQAGRQARNAFYALAIQELQLDCVATAHTRSDQAETVLFRMLRGTGLSGLTGIAPVHSSGKLIRPLIDTRREEIIAYLVANQISWREDSSNRDPRFTRNRIRHEVLPLLRNLNLATPDFFAQLADLARDEEAFWDEELPRWQQQHAHFPVLDTTALRLAPVAVRRRLVRRALQDVRNHLRGIDAAHIDQVLELADSDQGAGSRSLPGCRATRSFGEIRFTLRDENAGYEFEVPRLADTLHLSSGSLRLRLQTLEFATILDPEPAENGYNRVGDRIDASQLQFPLVIRNWRPGDRFHPPGRSCRRLKLLFQRDRVPSWERSGWPVLVSRGTIAWARRFGAAAGFQPTPETRRIVVIAEE